MRRTTGSRVAGPLLAVLLAATGVENVAGEVVSPVVEARAPTFSVRGVARPAGSASQGGDYLVRLVRAERLVEAIFADDFESGDLTAWTAPWGMPSGAVSFFDLTSCPNGWSELIAGRGRALLGLPLGGLGGGSVGTPYYDFEVRNHLHVLFVTSAVNSSGSHPHTWSWSSTAGGGFDWYSYDVNGAAKLLFAWNNGVGNEGSGLYPFTSATGRSFGVGFDSGHAHTFSLSWNTSTNSIAEPYLQMLLCRKN